MTPRETSPLLPKPALQPVSPHPIEADRDIAPEDAYESAVADATEGDIERQVSNGDASKHQGMPEVKKRMKYIFPAICVGVSLSKSSNARIQKLMASRSSSRLLTRPSSSRHTARSVRSCTL
jgi:hypothetical protein